MSSSAIHDTAPSAIQSAFQSFREELDDHHERRERLVKLSRDVTIASKKIIFSLHRLLTDGKVSLWTTGKSAEKPLERATQETDKQFDSLGLLFAAMGRDLQGDRYWRYARSVTGGVQEYIEALSFAYYLENHTLITYIEVCNAFKSSDGASYFPLSVEDYLLGISDLTGEIMRLSITAIGAQRSSLSDLLAVCNLIRGWYADMEYLTPSVRELRKKQDVTAQSLQKIEGAAYSLSVRGAEYGSGAFDLRFDPRSHHSHEDQDED